MMESCLNDRAEHLPVFAGAQPLQIALDSLGQGG